MGVSAVVVLLLFLCSLAPSWFHSLIVCSQTAAPLRKLTPQQPEPLQKYLPLPVVVVDVAASVVVAVVLAAVVVAVEAAAVDGESDDASPEVFAGVPPLGG